MVALAEPDYEKYLMDIQGTAFQVGRGKLATLARLPGDLPLPISSG